MALILNLETTTTNCSVSLSKDGETLVLREDYNSNYSHAETLHLFIDEVFKTAQLKPNKIDAIAVSKGPGSYTGLRIGVSTAKGLCFALDKPLISVPTLEGLAHQVHEAEGFIVPMLDARRMEVYSAVFDVTYNEVRGIKAEVLDENSFEKYLKKNKVYFIGNGVDKAKPLITHSNSIFISDKLPSASDVGVISDRKYKIGDFEDVAYFEPFYLKDFIAIKSKS